MSRFRNWCFTDFGKVKPEEWFNMEEVVYMVYQKEKCDKTDKLHYQGFVRFKNARTFSAVKKKHPEGVHWESSRNMGASINYCKKEETRVEGPFEFGKVIVKSTFKEPINQYDRVNFIKDFMEYVSKKRKRVPPDLI